MAAMLVLDFSSDHRLVVKFLSKGFPEDSARALVKEQEVIVNPYTFHFHSHLGWVVWAGRCKDCNDLLGVHKVPCIISNKSTGEVYEDENMRKKSQSPEIRALVAVGDEIHLRSSSRDWWIVHEFRPKTNSILLIAYDKKKHCRQVHYHEIRPLALMGCTVRRSVCVNCFKQFLISCECGEGRTSEHHSCVFQFPSPDNIAATRYLESVAEKDTGLSDAFHLFNADNDNDFGSNDDHVHKMQREASVRSWLSHKKNLADVKKIMCSLSRDLSQNRLL